MATVKCPLREAGMISRDQPALIGRDLQILYGELDLTVSSTADTLREAGLASGDRVALLMENGVHAIILLLALFRIGAVSCPVSTRLPIQAVREHLELIACDKLIARVGEPSRAVLSGISCHDPESLISTAVTPATPQKDIPFDLDQPATIFFTSGSTGHPKAVLHSFGNHYYSAFGANLNVRVRSGDRWLLSLPLYHVGGMGILFRCISSGACVVLMEHGQTLEEVITAHRVTHMSLVAAQLYRLLQQDLPKDVVERLKAIIVGGSEIPRDLIDRARARHWPVLPTYGLTEMNSQVTALSPHAPPAKHHTSGALLKHREMTLAGDGEILVRGPTLFQGYVEGSSVRCPVDADGWFATGDIGRMDEDGYLTVTGRKDHRFISGGENVQPEEIERVLCSFPEIDQAIVVPAPDREFGCRPVAFMQVNGAMPDETRLRRELGKRLPRFKIPVVFHPWPEQEQHAMKVSREALREQVDQWQG